MTAVIKVLIVGSEGPFRTGLASILKAEPGVTVVCEAGDGGEALNRAVELSPHVILIDVPPTGGDAFGVVLRISEAVPAAGTIVLADSEAEEDVSRALACGARGYLLKSSPGAEIVQAVKRAATGEIVLSPSIAAGLAARLSEKVKEPRLSRRETDILRLLGEGLSNGEIARRLVVTVSTVRTYVYRILDKLNLKSRSEAAAYARRLYSSYASIGGGLRSPGIDYGPGTEQAPVLVPAPEAPPPAVPAEASHGSEGYQNGGIAIAGERKQATALSVDLDLHTDSSRPVAPDSAEELLRECLDAVADVIHRHGGITAWFSTNGFMALFGVPISLEHAPHKALHTALEAREHLQEYDEQMQKTGIHVTARMGINTGAVIVEKGADGSGASYVPVADTASMAERLRDIAEPGSIVVSESTCCLTRDQYMFEPAGEARLRASGEPVSMYRLLGARTLTSKLDAAAMRGLSDFVGRRTETGALREAFERAKAGAGQVIGIVGAAGVGKSRLALEVRQALPMEECRYLEGGCISYDGAAPYLPVLQILKAYFDIKEGESESYIKEKIKTALSRLDERLPSICPALHDALSLEVDDPDYLALELPQRKEKLFEAVRDLLIRESQNRTLVIAIEDLHWIDSSTEEFLSYFMGWMAHTHIVLILLYRPEYVHAWASRSCYSQIRVDELTAENSAELVRSILGDGEVTPAVLEIVAGRAGGNPLFIEEFIRDLRENGAILKKDGQYVLSRNAWEIHVPDSIEGIIAARMDRLEGSLKHTLQVASVIGRDFNYRVLHAVTEMQDELKSSLLDLQGYEFIYEKSLFPEMEYLFKHALIKEVAYGSLLLKERKEIHERIGRAMEELYPERLEEIYEVLAHHYFRSDNLEKAYEYLKLSGDKTAGRYSNREAFRFYREAINILRELPDTVENRRKTVEVVLLMESPMKILAFPEDSLQVLEDEEELARELGDKRSLANLYSIMGLCHMFKGDSLQGTKYAEKCYEMAEAINDIELLAPTAFDLCSSYSVSGDFQKVVQVATRVIALLEKTHREADIFGVAFNFNIYSALLSYCGQAMGFMGNFEEGEALCEKGLRFAHKIDNLYTLGFAETMYGFPLFVKGDGKKAAEHWQNAVRYGEEGQIIPVIGIACGLLGLAYCLLGEPQTAYRHIERGLQIQRDMGLSMLISLHNVALSMVHFELGDIESARSCAGDALSLAQVNGEKWVEGISCIFLGRVLGKSGEPEYERAEECLLQGIRHCNENSLSPSCSRAHLYLGELYAGTGRRDKALKSLKKAEAGFRDMGMDYWLDRTQEVLKKM